MRNPWAAVVLAGVLLGSSMSPARAGEEPAPEKKEIRLSIPLGEGQAEPESAAVKIVVLLGLLSFLPALLLTVTSFTRIVIVLSFLRKALGIPELPPTPVLIGMSLFLTFFVMSPFLDRMHRDALAPYLDGAMPRGQALERGSEILQEFLLKQTREKDLALFQQAAHLPRPKGPKDLPLRVVIPAFVTSELRTAFLMGCLLYLPFLVIDLIIASVLLSMGMFMLPPMMVSIPVKLVLFLLVDGWNLLFKSLLLSFGP